MSGGAFGPLDLRKPSHRDFCPCEKGITHNEAENVAKEDAAPSVNVLLHAVLARASR